MHADVAAVDVCKRCGRFLCGECLELRGEDPYCDDCVKRLDTPTSLRARLVLCGGLLCLPATVFGAFFPALLLGAFVGSVVCLGFGLTELWGIRNDKSSRRGFKIALIGVVAAGLTFLLCGVWLAAIVGGPLR